jgi:hypothetical protein
MTSSTTIIEKAINIVVAYGDHLADREPSDDGIFPISALPYRPWEIKWAIMTLVIFETSKRPDERQQLGSFSVAWADLERYLEDHNYTKLREDLFAPDGSETRKRAESFIDTHFSKVAAGMDDFDVMLRDVDPASYSRRKEQMISSFQRMTDTLKKKA